MSEQDLEIGAYIRRERKNRRLTQEAVARMVRERFGQEHPDFHRNTVGNLERGAGVDDGTLTAVQQVLGLPEGRPYTGDAADVREFVAQWYLRAPVEKRAHATQLLMRFIIAHPLGGSEGDTSEG